MKRPFLFFSFSAEKLRAKTTFSATNFVVRGKAKTVGSESWYPQKSLPPCSSNVEMAIPVFSFSAEKLRYSTNFLATIFYCSGQGSNGRLWLLIP